MKLGEGYTCAHYTIFFLIFSYPLPPKKKPLSEQEYFKVIPPNPKFVDLASSTVPSSPVPDLVDLSLLYAFITQ